MTPTLARTHTATAPVRHHPPRTVRVALAGCGTVGGALLRLMRERESAITASADLRLDLVSILVRDPARPREPQPPADLLTGDIDHFLAVDADMVVEAVGGVEPALTIARHALSRGRTFVTANKAVMAAAGPELTALAARHDAVCGFEAAVAGGVPIIRTLHGLLPHTRIRSIRGVLNGTTNYVLTRMADGIPFEGAVREARELGFAEADPSRDLDGRDAADKIAILAWQAFGIAPDRLPLTRRGLLPDPGGLLRDARALGGVVRLVAQCAEADGTVSAAVEPILVPGGSRLASISAEENLVLVETVSSGTIALTGPGAGGPPTATALLGDVLEAASAARPGLRRSGRISNGADLQPYRWAISLPTTPAAADRLEAAAEATGVALGDVLRGRRRTRAVTGPVPRQRAAALVDSLKGTSPRLLRYEL